LFHVLHDNWLEPPIAREAHRDIENQFLQKREHQKHDQHHSDDNEHENYTLDLEEELVVVPQECLGTEIIGRDSQNGQTRGEKHLFSVHVVIL
jgi:hypothetical protein